MHRQIKYAADNVGAFSGAFKIACINRFNLFPAELPRCSPSLLCAGFVKRRVIPALYFSSAFQSVCPCLIRYKIIVARCFLFIVLPSPVYLLKQDKKLSQKIKPENELNHIAVSVALYLCKFRPAPL